MFTTWLTRNLKIRKEKKNIGKCYLLIRLQTRLTTTKTIKKQSKAYMMLNFIMSGPFDASAILPLKVELGFSHLALKFRSGKL